MSIADDNITRLHWLNLSVSIAVSSLNFPGLTIPIGPAMLAYCIVMMAYCEYMLITARIVYVCWQVVYECWHVVYECWHVVYVCWHVVYVCWHGVCNECYRNFRNVVPQSAPLSLATPLYRFRICGEQQHSSLIPRPSHVTLCLASPNRRLLFLLCALSLDMK